MKTSQMKLLAWAVTGVLGAALSGYIALFVTNLDEITEHVTIQEMRDVLNDVEEIVERETNVVSYDKVKESFQGFNWTGREAPKPDEGPTGPPEPPVIFNLPVTDLIQVVYMQYDAAAAAGSSIIVRYLPRSQVQVRNTYEGLMRVGDKLRDPNGHVTLSAIRPDGAVFSFADENRESETLLPQELEIKRFVAAVGEGQTAWTPPSGNLIARSNFRGPPPKKTQLYGPRVKVGLDDYAHISKNYQEILANEVRTRRHRNPRTGKYDGIEFSRVGAGSVAERHGISEGDVIRSINGHPVNSLSDAISYVKNNANLHSGTWEVEVENRGQVRTLYIDPPKQGAY